MTTQTTGYVALSHQMALGRQLEVIARNIANASTTAFKAYKPLVEQFLVDSTQREIAYVQDFGDLTSFQEGTITHTGSPLDVAIKGEGFFVADTPIGRLYTRNGHFQLDFEGQLVTTTGDPILDINDQPIVIDLTLGEVNINSDGTISVGDLPPERIQIVTFANRQELDRIGSGYFRGGGEEIQDDVSQTVQFMLESSNVEPVIELTAMIATSRSYQAAQQIIDTEHELQRKVAERLPKFGYHKREKEPS